MSLSQELSEIANASLGPKYINEPGVRIVTIKSYKLSEDDKDYKGKPYIEFSLEDKEGKINNAKFYRVSPEDSEDIKSFKVKMIKEFLTNAEVDESKIKEAKAYLNSVLGKSIKVLFRSEEYVSYDKNNMLKPELREIVKYGWSANVKSEIFGNQSHFRKPLSADKLTKYEFELDKWNKEVGSTQTDKSKSVFDEPEQELNSSNTTEEEDDLPFN
jgi:hypothetical protein